MDYRGKYYTGKIWIKREVLHRKIWIIEGSTTQVKYGL